MFKRLSQQLIYQDPWLKLYKDTVEYDDNSTGTYAWVERKSGVVVVVVNSQNKILLNKEYRYVIDDYDWEVPGGGIDTGETPQAAAVREVKEECGIEINELMPLGEFYPLNSFNTEKITVFLGKADSAKTGKTQLEVSESIHKLEYFTFDEILAMIDTGKIADAMTANVVQMAIRKLREK
jgi:mutator protein MutT